MPHAFVLRKNTTSPTTATILVEPTPHTSSVIHGKSTLASERAWPISKVFTRATRAFSGTTPGKCIAPAHKARCTCASHRLKSPLLASHAPECLLGVKPSRRAQPASKPVASNNRHSSGGTLRARLRAPHRKRPTRTRNTTFNSSSRAEHPHPASFTSLSIRMRLPCGW